MHRALEELVEQRLVELVAVVDGGVRLLGEHVVEAGRPLAAAEAGGDRAVVDHVRDAARVHVRVERVDALDHRLVDHLGEDVPVVGERVDLRHHRRAVDARGERVDGRRLALLGSARRIAHSVANLPRARLGGGGGRFSICLEHESYVKNK